jgi:hypothetical protein
MTEKDTGWFSDLCRCNHDFSLIVPFDRTNNQKSSCRQICVHSPMTNHLQQIRTGNTALNATHTGAPHRNHHAEAEADACSILSSFFQISFSVNQ